MSEHQSLDSAQLLLHSLFSNSNMAFIYTHWGGSSLWGYLPSWALCTAHVLVGTAFWPYAHPPMSQLTPDTGVKARALGFM